METEGSLLYSQEPNTCPFSEPDQSSPCSLIPFLEDPFWYGLPICTWVPSGLFPSDLLTKTLYAPVFPPVRATCSYHLILLDMIIQIIGEEY